jgi:hypothetical protein
MPPRRRSQGNRAARGRGARGARARGRGRGGRAAGGFVQASQLPACYQGGQPPVTTTRRRTTVRRRPAQPLLFPRDTEEPIFDMDSEFMELRGLPNGHQFNDFELAEYINKRLADYEHAREEMAAEHPEFQDYPEEEQMRTLYEFYPDIDWLQVRYDRD